MVKDSQNILFLWQNAFYQLFSVRGVMDLRQTEIHTAQPIVPELSAFDFKMAIEKVIVTSPGIDQIPGALIKAGL